MTLCTWAIEAKFDGSNWTDIGADVLINYGIRVSVGIKSSRVDERVADTGTMTFVLNNSITNNGGLNGYYTPGHTNCRTGFAHGLAVRLRVTYDGTTRTKFYGRIPPDGISISTGSTGKRITNVIVNDWMHYPATEELGQIAYESDVRIGDIAGSIADAMSVHPLSESYDSGNSMFEASYDGRQGGVSGMTEFARVAASEWGYIYVTRTAASDEVLRAESRHYRNETMYTNSPVVTLSTGMIEGEAPSTLIYNSVTVKVYPRYEDGDYQVIYALQAPIYLPAGETFVLEARYSDPDNRATSVSAKHTTAMVSVTDYILNSQSNGLGTNLTGDMTASATFGANSAMITVQNTGAVDGYITILQLRGRGIYHYEPVSYTAGSTQPELYIDMIYQDSIEEAQSIADYLQDKLSGADVMTIENVTFLPNKSSTLMAAFRDADVGSFIKYTETMSGFSSKKYFINGIDFEIIPGGYVRCSWDLLWDDYSTVYWVLGVAGRSELGTTANPAP